MEELMETEVLEDENAVSEEVIDEIEIEDEGSSHVGSVVLGGLAGAGLLGLALAARKKFKKSDDDATDEKPKTRKRWIRVEIDEDGNIVIPKTEETENIDVDVNNN